MLTKDTYREQYKDIVHLALIYMAIPVSAAENERIRHPAGRRRNGSRRRWSSRRRTERRRVSTRLNIIF